MTNDFGPPFDVEIRTYRTARSVRTVRNVRDLAEVLTRHWSPRGKLGHASKNQDKRFAAMQACADYLEGTGSATTARQCFLEAAQEAGLFVRTVECPPE